MTDSQPRFLTQRFGRRRVLALAGGASAAAVLAALFQLAPERRRNDVTNGRPWPAGGRGPTSDVTQVTRQAAPNGRPAGWTDETHSSKGKPNYDLVFPENTVNQIQISVTKETWDAMLANMAALIGARGTQGPPPIGGGGQPRPAGGQPGADPGPGAINREKPDWASATVSFKGKTWTKVGLRFKGNSSLYGSWRSGSGRVPFKLDFDEFEDSVPEVAGQRFHGFKQLSLANNFGDSSIIRETVAYHIFGTAGLVAAKTAPYEVTLDRGDGPRSYGIYTVIEVIDDTVIKRSFKDASGAIYKADGARGQPRGWRRREHRHQL